MHASSPSPDLNRLARNKARSQRSKTVRKAVRTTREQLASESGKGVDYDRDLMLAFARTHLNSAITLPLFSAAVALTLGLLLNMQIASVWAGLVLSSHWLMVFLARKFVSIEGRTDHLDRWRGRFILADMLRGLTWAALVPVAKYWTSDFQGDIHNVNLLILLPAMIVIVIGNIVSSNLRIAALAATLPVMVAVSVQFGLELQPVSVAMAGFSIGVQCLFYLLGQRLRAATINTIQFRREKEELIAELEMVNLISDESRRSAEKANLAKSTFLATMSHELRTPLNAILGFSEVIQKELMGPLENENYKQYISDIHDSGTHLLGLINEILDLSRIEAGKHEMNEEAVSLHYITDECVHMIDIKARGKDIKVIENFETNLPKLWADERSVRQIILNLLSNAVKFTPGGGQVAVSVGWTQKGGQYVLIQDSGPGIPADEIPIVLSQFGQGSNALQSGETGTGLGLPIVQALVQKHEGQFTLTSKLREGTNVLVTFPRSRVMEEMPAVETEAAKPLKSARQR